MGSGKRYLITVREDMGDSVVALAKELLAKRCFLVFHPWDGDTSCKNHCGHYHIFIEYSKPVDYLLIWDYFSNYRGVSVDMVKGKAVQVLTYLSHDQKYDIVGLDFF